MEYPIKTNILGREYTIEKHTYQEDSELIGLGGYCNYLFPLIVIADLSSNEEFKYVNESVLENMEKEYVRHEVIHAFLNESGLGQNAFASDSVSWTQNEEMVDWVAIQFPKIMKVYQEIGCI